MKTKHLLFSFAMAVAMLIICPQEPWAKTKPSNGDGSVSTPYLIGTIDEMQWFIEHVNNNSDNQSDNAKLTADIDLSQSTTMIDTYKGMFDGNNHKITINIENHADTTALFKDLYGTIKNLTVAGTLQTSYAYAGGICAIAHSGSTISCCTSLVDMTFTISRYGCSGGILGLAADGNMTIDNCAFAGSMSGYSWGNGGIVGLAAGANTKISNCLMIGNISAETRQAFTISCGDDNAIISNCYYKTTFGTDNCGSTQITDEQLANGCVAYLLNGKNATGAWGQNVDKQSPYDSYPVIGGTAVYPKDCTFVCSNDANTVAADHVFDAAHTYAEIPSTCTTYGQRAYKECTVCGLKYDADNNELSDADLVIGKSGHSYDKSGICTACNLDKNADFLCFTSQEDGNTIKLNKGRDILTAKLEYSLDKENWADYTFGTDISLNKNENVYFRACGQNANGDYGYNQTFCIGNNNKYYNFVISKACKASGNIMSLLDSYLKQTSVPTYAFYNLFNNCKTLTTAPKLPATTLSSNCYCYMFSGCESMKIAPELPALTMADSCYKDMFRACKSLTTAPDLPSTTLAPYCYHGMFYNCPSLTDIPEVLPATTLTSYCYSYMFAWCESLTKAPKLPALTMQLYCYQSMFSNCTSLKEAPELPATDLAAFCYYCMFYGCTSLLKSPVLASTSPIYCCYNMMYYNCSSLNTITVAFTDWEDENCLTTEWAEGLPSTGTFICPDTLPKDYSNCHIPEGWTIETYQAADGIKAVENRELKKGNTSAYNLAGQRVANDYKGTVIKNGKTYLNK